jgi:glycosyltransferase involved in cell wall biosynthesis
MRVLHFLDTVGRGGAEMQALDVCRNASRYGIDITLAVAGGGNLEEEFIETGVDYFRFDRKFPVDLYLASQLRKLIKEQKIDIVHGYQAVDGLHLYLATQGLKNVKRVLSFQGFIPDKRNRIVSKFLIPRMDANIVVSRGLQNWLREKDGLDTKKKFSVVYNGADPTRLKPTGRSIRTELGLVDGDLLTGMVGNFYRDPRKDQFTVCKALPAVFGEFENAHILFAGRIEDGAEGKFADCVNFCIEHELTDRVHFVGVRNDIPDILAELDIFVFSTLQEGLPVAVSEAMLAGVPMIVTDIEPLLEATNNGEFAEVFHIKDENGLAEKMRKLLSDKSLRQDLGKRAKEFAAQNFSIDAHLQALTALYARLLKNEAA